MRLQAVCYRFHDPKWAFDPTSGAGAAIHGGRFNPRGVDALYLALTIETAFAEISQGFARKFHPCLLVCYDVDCDDVADLREDAGRAEFGATLEEMASAWYSAIAERREPAPWRLARRLITRRVAGIIVPSFARGADPGRHHNLVLWRWSSQPPHKVLAYDPRARLPRDQSSWQPVARDP